MDRTCNLCNKLFTTVYGLKKHKLRKVPCIIETIPTSKNDKFKCIACNHTFTTNQSLQKHIIKTCLIIKNKNKTITNTDEINKIKKELDELKKQINNKESINIETQNIQNIDTQNIQNNITINCTILPYPEMNIKHDDLLSPFLKGNSAANEYAKISYLDKVDIKNSEANNQLISSAIIEMIENVYADSENDTSVVYLLKKDKVMVYQKDGIWCVKSLDNVNRELCGNIVQNVRAMRDKIVYPKEVYNGEKVAINETFRDLPTEYENNTSKILKNSKNELSIILESNKDKLKNDKLIT